jgi:hypothetical protein
VNGDYQLPFAFDGKIDRLTVKLGPMMLTAADEMKVREATARAKDQARFRRNHRDCGAGLVRRLPAVSWLLRNRRFCLWMNEGRLMSKFHCASYFGRTAALVSVAVLGLNPTLAQAGPCLDEITQFEAAIRQSAGNPDAGLTARQSVGAQLGHQPTVASLERAKQRLQAKFSATMARARRLDARGDRAGCTRALNAAKRMYIL